MKPLVAAAATLALLLMVGGGAARADAGVGWEHHRYQGLVWEAGAAPVIGVVSAESGLHGGFAATASLRYVMWAGAGTSLQGILRDNVLGEHFGLDLNTYGLRHQEGWLWMIGVDPALRNIVGKSTSSSRTRVSSLADVLLPEVGHSFGRGRSAWFLGWHLRADYLVSNRVAMSGRAGVQMLYETNTRTLVTAGLGITWR